MANQKLTELTSETTPLTTDLLYLVSDPSTTPASKKVTVSAVLALGTGGFTAEDAQDAVGTILSDDGGIDFTYDDATPKITADVKSPLTIAKISLTKEIVSPCSEVTMSGTLTLVAGTSNTYQFLNPNGSDRQVNLPASATGLTYFIMHIGGANTITVKDNGGSTVNTLTTGQFFTYIYSGSAWRKF